MKTDYRNQARSKKKTFFPNLNSKVKVGFSTLGNSFSKLRYKNSDRPKYNYHSRRITKSKNKKPVVNKVSPKSSISNFPEYQEINFLIRVFGWFGKFIEARIYNNPLNLIKTFFGIVFVIIVFTFANLQIYSSVQSQTAREKYANAGFRIIPAKRGQIYIRNLSAAANSNRYVVPLTSTQTQSTISFDPSNLKNAVEDGILELEEVAIYISAYFNLSYSEIYDQLVTQTGKENPSKYSRLITTTGDSLKEIESFLYENPETYPIARYLGLKVDEQEIRYYPQAGSLAATTGFVRNQKGPREDALKAGCKESVLENERRNTVDTYIAGDFSKGEYTIGNYGLEQQYCDELSGLNGRRALVGEISDGQTDELNVVHGSNLYLTIDKNIQKKSEQICQKYYEVNTNEFGAPDDCGILVMNAATGEILAMTSYPSFDQNNYSQENPKNFRNVVTAVDYEVGSIMKPITVAMALNENDLGVKKEDGTLSGISPSFTFQDFDKNGKPYFDLEGNADYIRNAASASYARLGSIPIETCLRLSINTCVSTYADQMNNYVKQGYLLNKFKFGSDVDIQLPGSTNGLTRSIENDTQCPFCFAQMSFGQGFTANMLQFARAFSALSNGTGKIVEPVLIEKIEKDDGSIETYTDPTSEIYQTPHDQQAVQAHIAKMSLDLLVKAVDDSSPDSGIGNAKVDGYKVYAKSGTAQIATRECDYTCHSNRGLYNHSCIGGVQDYQRPIMVYVKMGKPFPGQASGNFAGNYLCQALGEMMAFTFNYLDIPKNKV